jgi:uncharacterized membrane protein YGL010W
VTAIFRRQLAVYAQYHRDARNCMTHIVGIPAIFLAVLLPLALGQVTIGGLHTTVAAVLLLPAVIGWIALDAAVGAAMLIAIVPLLLTAEWVARAGGPAIAWRPWSTICSRCSSARCSSPRRFWPGWACGPTSMPRCRA